MRFGVEVIAHGHEASPALPASGMQCPGAGRLLRSEETKSWRWMYRTDKWLRELRPEQLLREPFCRECSKRGIRTRATDVDHIVDHKGDWDVFCYPSNLESLCHSCHSRKTAR